MKYLITFLLLCASAHAQTFRTVTADTNNLIRTNFTLDGSQLVGSYPAELLRTNGSAAALTNFPSFLLLTNGDAIGLTNFPASLLRTNGDGGGLTNLPDANLTNAIGVLAIGKGGTGATNASLAISNLLPSYTGNSNHILTLNSNATTLLWATNAGGGGGLTNVDLASTNVTGVLPVVKGGTGQTNAAGALQFGLGIVNGFGGVVIGVGATATNGAFVAVGGAIGKNATTQAGGAIGADTKALGSGGAVGNTAETVDGGAIGHNAKSTNGFAGGRNARALANVSVQLGIGTNSSNNTIQFLSAGVVDTNEWSALANAGVIGTNLLRSTTASNAATIILPAYSNNAGKVLAVNATTNNIEWITAGSSLESIGVLYTNLISTYVTETNFGNRATNGGRSITAVGQGHVFTTNNLSNNVVIGTSNSLSKSFTVSIGVGVTNTVLPAVAIGHRVYAEGYEVSPSFVSPVAIGVFASTYTGGAVALGSYSQASGLNSVAVGQYAGVSGSNSVQLGQGGNSDNDSIQLFGAGTISTNEWATLAAMSTYPTTNISVVGTNNTNTLVFSNGILINVTTP